MVWSGSLPVVVEMLIDSTWTNITSHVRPGIRIQRGLPNEGQGIEPCRIEFVVNNRNGDFSPRNPLGQWYGKIHRNTQVRVRVGDALAGLPYAAIVTAGLSSRLSTPQTSALDPANDLDVWFDGAMDTWESGSGLAGRWNPGGNNRAWAFLINASGFLELRWTPDGTAGSVVTATSTVSAGVANRERKALRAKLDVDNGSGGWTVTFETADTSDGTWAQLGDPVDDTGTTSVNTGVSALVQLGNINEFASLWGTGKVYKFALLDGIDGAALANPDFTAQQGGITEFTDDAGRNWSLGAFPADQVSSGLGAIEVVRLVDPGIRAHAEVSVWPQKWDLSGKDVWVPVVAQGVQRRLGQGRRPSRSPFRATIFRDIDGFYASTAAVAGYWPMEDTGGTQFASALPGGSPMTFTGDAPEFAATGAILGSEAVAVLGATTRLAGDVAAGDDGAVSLGILLDILTSPGFADNTPLTRVQMSSNSGIGIWEIRYKTGGGVQVRSLDHAGNELDTSGTLSFNLDGKASWVQLQVEQDGVNSDWTIMAFWVDDEGEIDFTSSGGTVSGIPGHPVRVHVAPSAGLADLGVGHVLVAETLLWANGATGATAFRGEHAGARARRLLADNGITARIVGVDEYAAYSNDPFVDDGTHAMGAQAIPTTFAEAFAETAAADMALVYEPRDYLGIAWRTNASLYDQDVALELEYGAKGEVAPVPEPVDDDLYLVNRVEARRVEGSTAVAEDSTSIDTVGLYETTVDLNVEADSDLPHHAGWRVHLGTWDEPRYPSVRVNLSSLALHDKMDLVEQVAQLDVGDRMRLTSLPIWAAAGDVDLMPLGFSEWIQWPTLWEITTNCVPYGPYRVNVLAEDDPEDDDPTIGWLEFDSCELTSGVDDDDTSWSITCDPADTSDADDFPRRHWIGGELITVTASTGGTTPTWTVTRSVNGIEKSHSAGADIELADPLILSLT